MAPSTRRSSSLTFEQMIGNRGPELRRPAQPRHRRRPEEMPELAAEVRLVVVRLQMRSPVARSMRAQLAIALLEPLDPRVLFGRHSHARDEAALERPRIDALLTRPLQDRLRASRRANPLEQVAIPQSPPATSSVNLLQEEPIEHTRELIDRAQIRHLVLEIRKRRAPQDPHTPRCCPETRPAASRSTPATRADRASRPPAAIRPHFA